MQIIDSVCGITKTMQLGVKLYGIYWDDSGTFCRLTRFSIVFACASQKILFRWLPQTESHCSATLLNFFVALVTDRNSFYVNLEREIFWSFLQCGIYYVGSTEQNKFFLHTLMQ